MSLVCQDIYYLHIKAFLERTQWALNLVWNGLRKQGQGAGWGFDGGQKVGLWWGFPRGGWGLRPWVSCQWQRKSCQGFPISSQRSRRVARSRNTSGDTWKLSSNRKNGVIYFITAVLPFQSNMLTMLEFFFYVLHCHLTFLFSVIT